MASKSFTTVGIIILLLLSLSSFEIVCAGRTKIFKHREKTITGEHQNLKKNEIYAEIHDSPSDQHNNQPPNSNK
ncbi:conserved hypothetical protein [Ricinus communis]|uniref:Uncharacterized protein n=1 Tax=Ricinus communis TaxID=3988 RepID=B9S788_RICCO|nr:conserved hypothetical protein [Ricinus communis]